LLENTKYDFLLQMDWINMDFGAPMKQERRKQPHPEVGYDHDRETRGAAVLVPLRLWTIPPAEF